MSSSDIPVDPATHDAGGISSDVFHHEGRPAYDIASGDAEESRDLPAVHSPPSAPVVKDQAGVGVQDDRDDTASSPALNIEDRVGFPSLSTAAQFATLPKRKQTRKTALESLNFSEDITSSSTALLSVSPSAEKWSKLHKDHPPSAATVQPQALPAQLPTPLTPAMPFRVVSLTRQPLVEAESTEPGEPASRSMEPERDQLLTDISNSAKNKLNVDSPSFTPAQLQSGAKKSTFSSQTLNAAPFTPKAASNSTTPAIPQDAEASFLNPAGVREFTPQAQNYDLNTASATNGMAGDSSSALFDPYAMAGMNQALPTTQYNPYAEDPTSMAGAGAPYYQPQGVFTAPLQPLYHLYAPVGQHRSDLTPYQRQPHDFFMSNDLREELQRKSADARQVLHNSQLPDVQPYHSLVPLEGPKNNQYSLFGSTVCWVYKATSKKNGHVYCLRRLQATRVSSKESTNTPLKKWKRINNGSIVTPLEAFTSRDFGDTSLIFIHHYHPSSKTLAEHHLSGGNRFRPSIQESLLWSYISQLCNALRTIHNGDLAARCIHPTKIILTEQNRIRLSACMILDVLEFDAPRPVAELQHEDLVDLGKLVLSLCLNQNHIHNAQISWQTFQQTNYSDELKDLVLWLITTPPAEAADQKTIGFLSQSIAHHLFDSFDASLRASDDLTSELNKSLENGRVARLVLKLGTINERPEFDNDPNWSENGERYTLKLFRDYVFHQVDANNNPVLNLGHMLSCLNKLDAGIDEKVYLTSRDHQTAFVVTYKELKKQVTNAFQELQKAGQAKPVAPSRGAF
ncbi:putative PAN2-PAN3 deadenylation complex subunit PAN3 [Seiridium cardinale]|uniref:PAN2-PAN3 deadenylation complex subunit PAN3 n=1 Tax=Seiridium cardinale TaxID=138064 RepID=A0ABR2XUA7_9PEZI